ncbi:hypothetical protein FOMPIDRAFT_1134430, partial [Fomitopsis schrenkii]
DRRPLDPPPVVKVRLFELASTGIEHELVDLRSVYIPFTGLRQLTGSLHSDPAFDSANSTADPSVEQILAYVDGVAIVQGTSRTPSLVGTSVVSISCYDLDGRSALLGVFHDLAVDVLGRFVLRYRAANMLWRGGPRERPIVAECWGAPFEVYAAHSFPGLQESTEMTKQLSRLGVPVTVRQSERKKRKNQPPRKREMRRLERAPSPD